MNVRHPPNVCVVGCGHWGKNLARVFSKMGRLYAVCESDPARLNTFREQYQVKGFSTIQEALADPGFDAVAIATPAEQHSPDDASGAQSRQACVR